MSEIWKYSLTIGEQSVSMPEGARPISAHSQYDVPTLWAIVDPSAPVAPMLVRVLMTGQRVEELGLRWKFCGTCLLSGGAFIVHVFAARPE